MSSDPYQAYPSFPAGAQMQMVEEPAVQLIAAGPAKQQRLTVAFRAILAIPHFFALLFLGIGAVVVAFLGWWGALFTGRLPGFAVNYLSGFFRWSARVSGYMLLLTDVYPPFTLDDEPGYPIVIAIPAPGPLNRVAVFFRFILGIWGSIVVGVLFYGAMTIVLFIAWLITLITGQLPPSLHQAYTAVLRYQTRYYCYYYMLTSTYPWALFGDTADASAPAWNAPAAPAQAETAWDAPAAEMPAAETPADANPAEGYGAQPGYGTAPAYGTEPGYATPQSVYGTPAGYGAAQPGGQPVSWPLAVSKSAKNLLILFIVLGVIFEVGGNVARIALAGKAVNTANAANQWNTADTALNSKMTAWSNAENACAQSLTCATKGDAQAAGYMSAFAGQVNAIDMPSGASTAAATLVSDANKTAADFTTLSHATSVSQYQSAVTSTGLEKDLSAVQADITNVANALNNS